MTVPFYNYTDDAFLIILAVICEGEDADSRCLNSLFCPSTKFEALDGTEASRPRVFLSDVLFPIPPTSRRSRLVNNNSFGDFVKNENKC